MLGVVVTLGMLVPASAAQPYGFLIRSTTGGSDFEAKGIEEVPLSGLRRSALPEPIREAKIYCAGNWTGVIAELDGVYYALNGKARGRDITVAGVPNRPKVRDGSGEGQPFQPYLEEPIAMIQTALSHCRHGR